MVKIETKNGEIVISNEVLVGIVGQAANECFGVAGMAARGPAEGLVALIKKGGYDKGVKVTPLGSDLIAIELHIVVLHGLNITAITESIVQNVKYTVEEVSGLKVSTVNVFVDGLKV